MINLSKRIIKSHRKSLNKSVITFFVVFDHIGFFFKLSNDCLKTLLDRSPCRSRSSCLLYSRELRPEGT